MNPQERRASQRFLMDLNCRFEAAGGAAEFSGQGKTVNMSSSGILLVTDRVLSPGLPIKIEMEWPVSRNQEAPLRLDIAAEVVRSEGGPTAMAGVKILRHAFHSA